MQRSFISHDKTFRLRWTERPALSSWSQNSNDLSLVSRVLFSKHSFNKYVTFEEILRGKEYGNLSQNLDSKTNLVKNDF